MFAMFLVWFKNEDNTIGCATIRNSSLVAREPEILSVPVLLRAVLARALCQLQSAVFHGNLSFELFSMIWFHLLIVFYSVWPFEAESTLEIFVVCWEFQSSSIG